MYEFNSYVIVKCFTVTVAVYECVFGCVCGSSVLFFLLFFLKKTTDELCHSGFSYSDFLTTIYQALRFQYFDIKLFHFAFQFISYLFRSRSLSLSLSTSLFLPVSHVFKLFETTQRIINMIFSSEHESHIFQQ